MRFIPIEVELDWEAYQTHNRSFDIAHAKASGYVIANGVRLTDMSFELSRAEQQVIINALESAYLRMMAEIRP